MIHILLCKCSSRLPFCLIAKEEKSSVSPRLAINGQIILQLSSLGTEFSFHFTLSLDYSMLTIRVHNHTFEISSCQLRETISHSSANLAMLSSFLSHVYTLQTRRAGSQSISQLVCSLFSLR